MPVTVEWDDEAHTTILYTFTDDWEWDEFLTLRGQVDVMLDGIDHPIGVILYIRDPKALPHNIYSRVGQLEIARHPLLQAVVFVSTSPMIQTIYGVLSQVYWSKLAYHGLTSTLQRARELIHENLLTE